jgi:hypothetical protein
MMWSWSNKTGSNKPTMRTEEAGTEGAGCALVHRIAQDLLHVDNINALHLT